MNQFADMLIPFIAGLLVGGLLVWLLLPSRRNHQKLEQQASNAQEELGNYRQQVDQHFTRTAELVNKMTQAYREVHEELVEGAGSLCSEEGKQRLADQSLLMTADDHKSLLEAKSAARPLDYAPQSQGTLAEDFGLESGNVNKATGDSKAPRDYAEADNGATPDDSKEGA